MPEETEHLDQLWDAFKEEFNNFQSLPMAVYISSRQGVIVKANNKAIELLRLPSNYERNSSIVPYYVNVSERETVIRRLKNKGHNIWLENETLQFNIPKGSDTIKKSFRYFSKSCFRDSNDRETLLGSLCLLFEISEIERFRTLEKLIPVGTFEVSGKDMEVIYHNEKFDELLCVNPENKTKLKADTFFIDQNEFKELEKKLVEGEPIENQAVRLKRIGNHSNILANLSIVPEVYISKSGEKKLLSAKGFIQDITFSKFLDAPIGLYVVMRNSEDEEVITWANNEYAKINGFENSNQCLGVKIKELYNSKEKIFYEQFLNKFEEEFREGNYLLDYWLEFTNRSEELKQVFIHAMPIETKKIVIEGDYETEKKFIIGRVGAMIDISNNVKQQLYKEIDEDYAAFLHLFSAFVHDVQTTIISVMRGHSTDVLTNIYDIDVKRVFNQITQSTKKLNTKVNEFLGQAIGRGIVQDAFLYNINLILVKLLTNLSEVDRYTSFVLKGMASEVRRNLMDIRKRIREIPGLKNKMPAELRKDIEFEISEGLRFARLISLWQLTIQSEGMFADLDILSRVLKPLEEFELKSTNFFLEDVLGDVKADLTQYAKNERVTIKTTYTTNNNIQLFGIPRNIYAVLYNLLHNAIKYTWKKPSMMESFVSITISEKQDPKTLERVVHISFENRGDAILKIEEHKIFRFGYRGIRAVNGRKKGTGVGLWHAKKIAKQHGGVIIPESKPISEKGVVSTSDDILKPYITTMVVILPIKNKL